MNQKRNYIVQLIIAAAIAVLCTDAYAEVSISDASQLLGTWTLKYTSPQLDGEKRPSDQTWEFRSDGTMVSTASDKRAKGTFTVSVPYEIVEGKIVTGQAGRPGKKITYAVADKADGTMTLKGPSGFMFFSKQ